MTPHDRSAPSPSWPRPYHIPLLAVLAVPACSGPGPFGSATTFGSPSPGDADDDTGTEGSSSTQATPNDDGTTDDAANGTTGPGPGPDDGNPTTGDPDPTAGATTGGDDPQCVPDSVCCAADGTFVPQSASGPGCSSGCSACDGQGSCEPLPAGPACGGGAGTCDGEGGCDVPTCNDGAQTLEPGEQCDGNNLGGQSCMSQGYDGGTLSCQVNCSFDTSGCYQASIVPSRGLGSWTPVFIPDTDCSCDAGNPDCRTLYQGRVTSIVGNTAQMQFRKMDGTNPSVNVSYWVVVGDIDPTCLDLHAYVERTSGIWPSATNTLTVNVSIWPSQAQFDADPCGMTKDLFVITGGAGFPATRLWYQEQAVHFTKVCS